MRLFATIILAALLCATASAQTLKSLMYNTTNGQVVAATNLVWTNAFSFSTNTVAAQIRTNLALGSSNAVSFDSVNASYMIVGGTAVNNPATAFVASDGYSEETHYGVGAVSFWIQNDFEAEFSIAQKAFWAAGGSWTFYNPITFNNTTNAATTRTNLGLGWSALTNTNEANFYAATLTSYSSIQAAIQNDPGTARGDLELGNGITATNTFVSYNGTNYTTNSVTISNGIITGWTQ